jgi:hypothetical protein
MNSSIVYSESVVEAFVLTDPAFRRARMGGEIPGYGQCWSSQIYMYGGGDARGQHDDKIGKALETAYGGSYETARKQAQLPQFNLGMNATMQWNEGLGSKSYSELLKTEEIMKGSPPTTNAMKNAAGNWTSKDLDDMNYLKMRAHADQNAEDLGIYSLA